MLFISIDTLPADRVGAYGCPTVRSAEIDRLARQGIQVRNAISPAPLTLPAHTTMLTGLSPAQHGVRENGLYHLRSSFDTVAELLPTETETGAFVGALPLAKQFGLDQGFDRYDDQFADSSNPMRFPERNAESVFASASRWLQEPLRGRRFLWIHLYDPHHEYAPPSPWKELAANGSTTAHYETEVAYADYELGRFLREVGQWGADRTWTILLVSDHGESLGSHREPTHGVFIYDATQRVPMIMAGPSIQPALQVATRTLADVAPTILMLFAKPAPAAWTGSSLLSSTSAKLTAYLETLHPQLFRGWSPLFGLRTDRWKYIRAPRPELYDLSQDPGETSNVIQDQPEVARELSTSLQSLLDAAPPPEVPQADEQTMEQLRSLGYVSAVEPGSIPQGGKDPKDGIESLVALFEGEEAYLDSNFARAEKYLLRALQLDPQSKEACSFLSGTYFSLGRYDLSAEYATRALSLVPHMNEAPLHTTRGEALLALGKKEEAAKSFRESLRMKPGDAKVEELLRRAENSIP
ncbi:MAG TPA: sulfatase-like hydrolase/transferase [bacterium]|nr:sulfatase-like hydrolase/transferase [bacterium]